MKKVFYATKGQKRDNINKTHNELFLWLKERFPDFVENRYLKRGQLEGEERKTRVAYEVFLKFYKIGLSKDLVWLYAKL